MRVLSINEMELVVGGNGTAPTCTTTDVKDANGNVVGSITVCECPSGTEMTTTTSGGTATMTCK